jgi:hypothetical protein
LITGRPREVAERTPSFNTEVTEGAEDDTEDVYTRRFKEKPLCVLWSLCALCVETLCPLANL